MAGQGRGLEGRFPWNLLPLPVTTGRDPLPEETRLMYILAGGFNSLLTIKEQNDMIKFKI